MNLIEASRNGHLDIVRYLVMDGVDIHADYDWAVQLAAEHEYLNAHVLTSPSICRDEARLEEA
jgi:hypothetical protein